MLASNYCFGIPEIALCLRYADAFHTAHTAVGIFDFDMAMTKEVDFAKHITGACVIALPASHTSVGINSYICCAVTVAKFCE